MDNSDDQYNFLDADMFFQPEELDSYFDDQRSAYYDSSSPDGTQSSLASKNIVSERNRRKKLNERLYALRSVVPNITKMDKASTIKDAIAYIQSLHDEERRIQAEISELESAAGTGTGRQSNSNSTIFEFDHQDSATFSSKPKRTRLINDHCYDFAASRLMPSPIQLLELRVSNMGEKTIVVSLTCSKRTDTMVKLCEIFESLKLKIITASITAFSGTLLKTVFVEADEEEKEELRLKIEAAIAALNDPDSPMSI